MDRELDGPAESRPVIETRALTKRYPGVVAVDGLDLRVQPGEVFGFLGPNGAGKSTTIRLLLDLARPTSGSATIFGLDSRRDAQAIHRRVGLLPSEPGLPFDLTGTRYLDFYDDLRGIDTKTTRGALAERLDADLSRRIREMSTGNRQKVALLQALAHRPDLIVLDEPSRGLDPLIQHTLHRILREERARGATVFLSSHSLNEVERVADRVGIIREGRLVTVETLATLKANATRSIELELAGPVDPEAFRAISGVDEVVADGNRLTARVRGSVDDFLRTVLGATEVRSVRSAEANLQDVFLQYYRDDGRPPDDERSRDGEPPTEMRS